MRSIFFVTVAIYLWPIAQGYSETNSVVKLPFHSHELYCLDGARDSYVVYSVIRSGDGDTGDRTFKMQVEVPSFDQVFSNQVWATDCCRQTLEITLHDEGHGKISAKFKHNVYVEGATFVGHTGTIQCVQRKRPDDDEN